MFRVGVGAMPFLLPLLAADRFKLTRSVRPDTFTSTMGALIVKGAAPWNAQAVRLPNVLIANAILGGLSIAACAAFSAATVVHRDGGGADDRRLLSGRCSSPRSCPRLREVPAGG